PAPRFSWVLEGAAGDTGKAQSGYRIYVQEVALNGDAAAAKVVWDTGVVKSAAQNQIAYAGAPLKAHSRYVWRVSVLDEKGAASAWSAPARFTTGPLTADDWAPAQWIGEPETRVARLGGYTGGLTPSPLLRKEITLPAGKKIASAYLNATALGIYEFYINGKKVGKNVLAPEYTRYDKHLQFQTYDVAALLTAGGANALGATLGDGWFSGARWQNGRRGGYGEKSEFRKLLARLTVNFTDGTSAVFGTDGSWKYLQNGPIERVAYFAGETYDARKNPAGWDKPNFAAGTDWKAPVVFPKLQPHMAKTKLVAQRNEPIAIIKDITPVSFKKVGADTYLFDLGQNIAGHCLLRLPYNPGTGKKIVMSHAEWTQGNGLYTANLRGAGAVDTYIAGNEKEISYEPRFTYHGFRFVLVSGLTQPPTKETLTGRVVASSAPQTGYFETSHPKVNKLWNNILWTQWGNFVSIITDCPQRDEREGYTADGQVFLQTACYNIDMAAFLTKWSRDMSDSQLNGKFYPDFAPHDGLSRMSFRQTPGWGDGGVITPWRVYENYGDKRVLEENYTAVHNYVDWLVRSQKNGIWEKYRGNDFGDWLRLGGNTDKTYLATGYFYNSTKILAQMAKVLGKEDDAKKFSAAAAKIKDAYNKRWVKPNGTIGQNDQPAYGMAFFFDLLPEAQKRAAGDNFARVARGNISAGIHSTAWVMEGLGKIGRQDLGYNFLFNEGMPSWFFSINQGATTVWEHWDGYNNGRFWDAKMNSLNHVAFGVVGEWFYRHVAGIQLDPENPGYKHFFIRPAPDKRLAWVKSHYDAITGRIEVEWKRDDAAKTLALRVRVPVNTTATVTLPYSKKTVTVGSGEHKWTDAEK
ncbi:MAG: glycoside hydrolase family 78 protein, partial [Puniceicoccales bacterium]|nr:glycoside hydrolase family 78 protein [Puniceicoccales bacterium]